MFHVRQRVLPDFKIGRSGWGGGNSTLSLVVLLLKFIVTANQATRSFGLPLASPFLSRERASWRAHRYKILNLVISSKGRLPRIIEVTPRITQERSAKKLQTPGAVTQRPKWTSKAKGEAWQSNQTKRDKHEAILTYPWWHCC